MEKRLQLGFNPYFSDVEYHGDKNWLSSSVLKDLLKDPASVRRKILNGPDEEEKAAFVLGQYVHWKYLEPEKQDAGFVEFGGARRYGKLYDKMKEENPNKTILLREERLIGDDMIKALESHKIASTLNKNGNPEVTVCSILDEVPVKVRMDYDLENKIVDLKTTSSPLSYDSLVNTIIKYGYHISAALYLDVVNSQNPATKKDEFILVFINKKTMEIAVCRLSPETVEIGRREYKRALRLYKELKAKNYFTAEYEDGILDITI